MYYRLNLYWNRCSEHLKKFIISIGYIFIIIPCYAKCKYNKKLIVVAVNRKMSQMSTK